MEGANDAASTDARALPRSALLAVFLVAFAFLFGMKVAQERYFRLNDFDTGIYANVAWNISHGKGFHSDVLGKNHLGEHFSPITAAIAPLYLIAPTPLWVLLAQSLAVALCFPMLARLADMLLPPAILGRSRLLLIGFTLVLFFLYRPAARAHLFQFHPSTLGMPMVLGAIIALHQGRRLLYWLCVALLLTTKELAIASLAGLAIYAFVMVKDRRTAAMTLLVGAVSAALIFKLIMPHFRTGDWGHMDRVGPSADIVPKSIYLVQLLLGIGLLPLLRPAALLAVVPLVCVNLATLNERQYSLKYHYDDQSSIFLMVAALHGLARVQRMRLSAIPQQHRKFALGIGAALVFACTFWMNDGAFSEQWRNIRKMDHVDLLRRELAPYIDGPRTVAIASQTGLGPYLCYRDRYVSLQGDAWVDQLREGDTILLSPEAGETGLADVEDVIAELRTDPRAELIADSEALVVFKWLSGSKSSP